MNIKIFVSTKVAGTHYWPDAGKYSENHKYLANVHRHMFHIKVTKVVSHDNRDIEFLKLKDDLTKALQMSYIFDDYDNFNFLTCSCEQIATTLCTLLHAHSVEVSEDGENGAIVTPDWE